MIDKAYLEITNICNLSCSFCHKTGREKRQMTAEEFEQLTDRLVGEVRYLYFHLMGEPLLHPLLPQFIKRAWEKGFRPMLTTNGTLLKTRGEALLEAPPYKVSISLHAPAANAAFADADYLPSSVDFAEKAAKRGVISVLRLWNLGGEGEEENAPILRYLHTRFPGEWGKVRGGSSLRLADKLFLEWGEEFDWPDLSAPACPPEADCFCFALRDQIGILVDGTVVPCCLDAEGALALGNLLATPLARILTSDRARGIYDGFSRRRATEPLCQHCGYAKRFSLK
ncbi:MAG: radical SAM protein [Clostridia bacterium]|nr:radical SAM protein [Clostridia bacterium]